ncbi:MAG: glycine cleavage system protein GcvH [Clostridiaceae bacterium]|jgi:glycine cleavage system H protein|nr:glycine cleavage system protein GcvH [Clostridiaceae bacterium]
MIIKDDLKYSKEHEWVKVTGDKAYIGITDYAQEALGDIVFVELPEVGMEISAGDTFGVVESVKAASDIYCPVSGTVTKINEELIDSPEIINEDPYGAWIIEIELSDTLELDELMDDQEYEDFCLKEG